MRFSILPHNTVELMSLSGDRVELFAEQVDLVDDQIIIKTNLRPGDIVSVSVAAADGGLTTRVTRY